MLRIQMDRQGRVTIPTSVRRQLGLDENADLLLELGPSGLLLRPRVAAEAGRRDWSPESEQPMVADWQDSELGAETVVNSGTHRPHERRRIISRLASPAG